MYGKDNLNEMSEDEFNYWKTISYWAPFTYERYLKNRGSMYVKKWGDKPIPVRKEGEKLADNLDYIKWLARSRTDYGYYLKKLGIFSFP